MSSWDSKSVPLKRRRVSLRLPHSPWFVVVSIVVIIASAGISYGLSAYQQQIAINEIKRGGGDVWVEPSGPSWFRQLQRDHCLAGFGTVTIVTCYGDDETVARLRQFRGLRRLHLYRGDVREPITNRGLGYLHDLPNLYELWVEGDFTDESLASFSGLTGMKQLMLFSPNVTDGGIAHLTALTNLIWLDLAGTKLTEAGLTRLRTALPSAKVEKLGTYSISFPGREGRSHRM